MSWPRTYRYGTGDETRRIVRSIYEMAGGKPMIDLGCRHGATTVDLEGTWMDIDPQPDSPAGIVTGDIRDAPELFTGLKKHFNLAIMTDVIEHLEKSDGEKLLAQLPVIADAILIFSPIGEMWISKESGPHTHRSGWWPEDLWAQGWEIWEWPMFHDLSRFEGGTNHGAFFAWKFFTKRDNPTVKAVSKLALVGL